MLLRASLRPGGDPTSSAPAPRARSSMRRAPCHGDAEGIAVAHGPLLAQQRAFPAAFPCQTCADRPLQPVERAVLASVHACVCKLLIIVQIRLSISRIFALR